ncbi:Retrovirus-related Pol polyprotein from transposon [Ceratobasidium sp. AG-Ba]|nr:Retrovirus-related Pol polyprotein from transposon [Ceratobasidium sp. AG-Ba]
MTQKEVSPRQARWLETLSQFDFEIKYIEGSKNVLADALSRIYSNEPKGTERAKSEYVPDMVSESEESENEYTRPLLGGRAAQIVTDAEVMSLEVRRNPARDRQAPKRYDPEIPGINELPKKKTAKGKKTESKNSPISDQLESSTPEVELEGETVPNKPTETSADDLAELEQVAKLVSEVDVIESIRDKYDKDESFGKIVENIEQFPGYNLVSGLLYMSEHE